MLYDKIFIFDEGGVPDVRSGCCNIATAAVCCVLCVVCCVLCVVRCVLCVVCCALCVVRCMLCVVLCVVCCVLCVLLGFSAIFPSPVCLTG